MISRVRRRRRLEFGLAKWLKHAQILRARVQATAARRISNVLSRQVTRKKHAVETAAVKTQAVVRGHLARKQVKSDIATRKSAVVIQKTYRGFKTRASLRAISTADSSITADTPSVASEAVDHLPEFDASVSAVDVEPPVLHDSSAECAGVVDVGLNEDEAAGVITRAFRTKKANDKRQFKRMQNKVRFVRTRTYCLPSLQHFVCGRRLQPKCRLCGGGQPPVDSTAKNWSCGGCVNVLPCFVIILFSLCIARAFAFHVCCCVCCCWCYCRL